MQNQIFTSFLVIIALPTIILFGAIISVYTRAIEERTIHASELVVKESVKRIDTLLNEYRESSMQVYYNDSVMDFLGQASTEGRLEPEALDSISKTLGSIVNADKYLMTAVLRSNENLIVVGTDIPQLPLFLDQFHDEVYKVPGRLIWIPTTKLKSVFGLNALYFGGTRLIRKDGREIGQLLFLIREEFFDDVYAGAIPSSTGKDIVVSPEGTIISSSGKELIGRPLDGSMLQELVTSHTENEGYHVVRTKEGRLYYVFARSDETGWFFIRELSEDEVFAGVVRVRQSLIIIMGFYTLFLGMMSFFLSRGLGRPLRRLTASVDMIGSDSLEIPQIRDRFTGDEILSLEDSLRKMTLRIQMLIDDVSREERARNEAELKALRNHISPHFVYNTLDTIRWMAVINKQKNIQETVSALDRLLRYAADTDRLLVSLEEELEVIREYVLIQNMRYPDIMLHDSVSPKLLGLKVNKFILQTLVENSILHGFRNLETTGIVEISAGKDQDMLVLTVRDNGCGFDDSAINNDERPHTGLANVNMRLSLNYGAAYGVTVRSIPGEGTEVDLRLPILE